MDYREWKEKQERSDHIWLGIIVLSFIVFWPLGVALVIMKNAGKLPVIGTGQNLQYWKRHFEDLASRKAAPPPVTPKQQAREKKKLKFGKPMLITGIVLAAIGALSLLPSSAIALLDHTMGLRNLWGLLAPGSAMLAGGIALMIGGALRQKRSRRLQQYADMIDPSQGWLSIHELADRVKRPYKQVCEDLQKMTEMAIWDTAWVDHPRGRLMFMPYEAQEEPKREAPPQPEAPASRQRSHADQILQQIRADNDLIDDAEISRKIDRIETLTGKIFDYLEQHPERERDLQTFMDYYLPQTLKTLEAYARLEAQGIETESIRMAKGRISGVLDKLCDGYEKQLDKLFETDAMDISADIAVMERMLKKDGLTDDDFVFKTEQK